MRVENYIGGSPELRERKHRMNQVWHWIAALDAFDYCDSAPLSELMASDEEIPVELRPALARIISGERVPNRRAAANLKIPASERMKIAGTLSTILGLVDEIKYSHSGVWVDGEMVGEQRLLYAAADQEGKEVIQLQREMESRARQYIENAAESMSVSEETIENLLRDLRKKIENYPNV